MESDLKILIEQCKQNKRTAQTEIYNLFSAKLFSVCLRYSDNYEDAQDTFQDGFIIAFHKISQFQFKGSFEGWLKRIMINTCIEKHRKKNYLFVVDEELTKEETTEEFDEELETTAYSYEELLELIKELPPRYRQVFNLYVFEEYPHQKIAEMLGISEGTSKSNLSRAREKLMESINKKSKEKIATK
ncbi:MAG: sigma-70 family RNA polymerase sigma factor [Weeksellaceae bacterium]